LKFSKFNDFRCVHKNVQKQDYASMSGHVGQLSDVGQTESM
jgi:hypothetical protein